MDLAEKASKLTIMVPKEDGEEGEEKFQQHGVKVVNILENSGSFFFYSKIKITEYLRRNRSPKGF